MTFAALFVYVNFKAAYQIKHFESISINNINLNEYFIEHKLNFKATPAFLYDIYSKKYIYVKKISLFLLVFHLDSEVFILLFILLFFLCDITAKLLRPFKQ